jgi:L-2-hydroxyglutarate oxidase LhgO
MEVVVLEKEDRVGVHQSGRNSGVVHSGVHYRPGSQKARMCIEGAEAMARFCEENDLPLVRCGKLIVAAERRELPGLEEIHRRGVANGVRGLALVGPEEMRDIEPLCRGVRALRVPGAAITDYGVVTSALARRVAAAGGQVRTGARVTGVRDGGSEVVLETGAGPVAARFAINCAGLHSDRIARLAGADPGVVIVPFRGEYFELAIGPSRAVRGLIYPVPDPALPFLGVHLTKRIDGGVLAGPNAVLALKREGYRKTDVDLSDLKGILAFPGFWRMARRHWRSALGEAGRSVSKGAFLRALRRMTPDLRGRDLLPGGSGVRAQAVDRDGRLVDDFLIVRAGRMIHVLNVPSPAATASLVIGRAIVQTLATMFDPGGER